jgi:GNAT superfamily N-acetyltransferase
MRIVEIPFGEAVNGYPQAPTLPAFDPKALSQQRVDSHYLVQVGEDSLARASLWWSDVPLLAGERLGVIGHFAAGDQISAAMLLSQLLERLHAQGCTLAIGPMDGNTWRRYRFVTDPGYEPPFFMEPGNPATYPEYFSRAGFTPLAQYSSARVTDLTIQDQRIPRAIVRLKAHGIHWRPLDMSRFEAELRAIYRLSVRCFTQNFLYTPIDEAEFVAQYQAIAPYVQGDLTLMAERDGALVGYLFGIPDHNQAHRGEKIDTFIIKTVAALPGRRSAGLGTVLVAESQRIGHERGYRSAIHALMHESNKSKNISAHYAHRMRRYTLYQQRLAAPA